MKVVSFPDATQFSIENTEWRQLLNSIILEVTDTNTGGQHQKKVYNCSTVAVADTMLAAINTFAGDPTLTFATLSDGGTLTWVNISPNTHTIGDPIPNYVVAGTGFLTSNIDQLKLDDGTHHTEFSAVILNDTTIQVGTIDLPDAGVYTLYFTTDFGASWTSSTLTITVSP